MFDAYRPMLHQMPSDLDGQWKTVRNFAETWAGEQFPDLGYTEIESASATTGVTLGKSIQNWIRLCVSMNSAGHNLLRDVFTIEPVPGHDAISLMIQGEGDFYWALRKSDLANDDPPVICFHLDHDNETERFLEAEESFESIVEFAVSHMAWFIHRRGLNFGTHRVSYPEIVAKLDAEFAHHSKIGKLHVFESENVIAFVPSRNYLNVTCWEKLGDEQIPPTVLQIYRGMA